MSLLIEAQPRVLGFKPSRAADSRWTLNLCGGQAQLLEAQRA